MKTNVAIASCFQTLEDYLKSDVCDGYSVHCQFPKPKGLCGLDEDIRKTGMLFVRFSDGEIIRNSEKPLSVSA